MLNFFRDVLWEYEVKYGYHVKRYINQKVKVGDICMSDGYD
jgi:hypothetical protein